MPGKNKKKRVFIILSIIMLLIIVLVVMRRNASPILQVSPTALNFGEKETEMEFIIKNTAKPKGFFRPDVDSLEFKIQTRTLANWLKVKPLSGVVLQEPQKILVTVDRDLLLPGTSIEELKIATNAGDGVVRILVKKEEGKITLLSPTTHSAYSIGRDLTLEWTANSGVSNFVNIFLCLNKEKITPIVSNYNFREQKEAKGSFPWAIDNYGFVEGSNYSVRIEDANDPLIFDEVGPIKIYQPLEAVTILNQTEDHQIPSTVQFIFSLRDQNNHAILFDSNEVGWKDIKIWENDTEIDYLESHALLYNQDDFQLQVMLVLDFSASMYDTKDEINTMVLSVKDLIDSLNETHQVGVVEFHRPDEPPSVLQTFTTYKNATKEAIDNFSTSKLYRDFSICWDAVKDGLQQFPVQPDPNIFKTLIFLSDGFDNSSFNTPDHIIQLAKERDVHIFVLGLGEVHMEDVLKNIAYETGGTYVHSENISALRERFKQVIHDVKGQYKIKYISPKKPEDGKFIVKSEVSYKGVKSTSLLQDEIDPNSIFDKTIEGVIRFSAPADIKYNEAEIFMWCEHAPRYINEFRFWIGTEKPFKVTLTSSNDGGLCQDWILTKQEDGWYQLISPDQSDQKHDLEFGDFGTICKITVTDILEEGLIIPFKLDNSIYDVGQAFYGKEREQKTDVWTTNIYVGKIIQ